MVAVFFQNKHRLKNGKNEKNNRLRYFGILVFFFSKNLFSRFRFSCFLPVIFSTARLVHHVIFAKLFGILAALLLSKLVDKNTHRKRCRIWLTSSFSTNGNWWLPCSFVSKHPLELRFVSTFCVCSEAEESRIFEDFVLSLAPEGQSTKDLVNNGAHKKAKATNGCLVLDGCHAFLECRTLSTLDAGDHSLIYAEVKSGNWAGGFNRFFYFHHQKWVFFMIQFDLHTYFSNGWCFNKQPPPRKGFG